MKLILALLRGMKPGKAMTYIPDSGDIVWIMFNPQAGHEQAGHRPALVLSPKTYNSKVGLAILCPVTNQVKGYPFEVKIPDGLEVGGAVLSDQVKSLDWKIRQAKFSCKLPSATYNEVVQKLSTLIHLQLQNT
jgi:mRNA interferase MazF